MLPVLKLLYASWTVSAFSFSFMIDSSHYHAGRMPTNCRRDVGALASAAKDPTVGSLHSIVWAGDSDSHVQVLVLWRKTNLVVTTLITQARLEHYFVTLVACGHSDVDAQNRAAFVNRQRFVVSGLELAHDCPGIAHGSNRNAARRFDL